MSGEEPLAEPLEEDKEPLEEDKDPLAEEEEPLTEEEEKECFDDTAEENLSLSFSSAPTKFSKHQPVRRTANPSSMVLLSVAWEVVADRAS